MKRFELIVTEKNGNFNFTAENNGFNALELIAILEMKKNDVIVQVQAQTEYDRTTIIDGKKFKIVESEETE